ncbi:Dyp-type peroxidase [Stenomitos frigidus]|uniref:DyP dimeric alpha+beta barrel domain-containing protein n=1 Tax=Stenomitos frigidus ULC18 TaxID=2107698 RepID=A0A2T1EJD0_9CYAN|nr:Dyp-type peroxidase [Stenomitos frigidus]PSB32824.1 hypothetical protein C7B82_04920 [Stenomitos frigidus ULC18]
MANFVIQGRVIDRNFQKGASSVQVEAWDKDLIINDLVGAATTDDQGGFRIEFESAYFQELFADRSPDLFFKIFQKGELIRSTENAVLWNVAAGETEIGIEVELKACPFPTAPGASSSSTPAPTKPVVREAPQPSGKSLKHDPTRPAVPTEPVLAIENIQGNILSGFNKDQQTLLFLRVDNQSDFRRWLGELIPFIATTAEVLAFNRLFKEIRRRRSAETRTVQATWVNIALSFRALQLLTEDDETLRSLACEFPDYQQWADDLAVLKADAFKDEAFKQGLQARSIDLGDPRDAEAGEDPEAIEGNRHNWLVGGPKNEADVVVIVASDSPAELAAEVARIEETIYSGRTHNGKHANSGVTILYKQQGATLPPPLVGHEHFGFLDGVSQPGVRGRISEDEHDVLTLRQNPQEPLDQGKPGQDLLWPGEFIFGYPDQDPLAAEVKDPGVDSLTGEKWDGNKPSTDRPKQGPIWAKDGSFLVIRRLRQDVGGFHKFLADTATTIGTTPELLGAKLVGRWKSGAPILRAQTKDNPKLADNDCANNHFEFVGASEPIPPQPDPDKPDCLVEDARCIDNDPTFEVSPGDALGAICPWAGHIRKSYPRDDESASINPNLPPGVPKIGEVSTQTHRLLRRGIPFGQPYYPPNDPDRTIDSGNRGLVFAAYQTSIIDQFEFVTQRWVNSPGFKETGTGHDPIIGQNNTPGEQRKRTFKVTIDGKPQELSTNNDWVIPTGGGYFFAPAINALCLLTGRKR